VANIPTSIDKKFSGSLEHVEASSKTVLFNYAYILVHDLTSTLERPKQKKEDNIKIDLKETKYIRMWTGFMWFKKGNTGGLF
jgi:hypothetical protein